MRSFYFALICLFLWRGHGFFGSRKRVNLPVLRATRKDFINNAKLCGTGGLIFLARPKLSEAKVGSLPELKDNKAFLRSVILNATDLKKAIFFYQTAFNMQVLREEKTDTYSSAVLAFGPDELKVPDNFAFGVQSFAEYGGHTTLELRENLVEGSKGGLFYEPGNVVEYLQFGVPALRVSKVLESGGSLLSNYGWTEVFSPDGLLHKVCDKGLLSTLSRIPDTFLKVFADLHSSECVKISCLFLR